MELALFPLNAVLFPGGVLPIHVFEERYKLLVGRCLEEKVPFGVVLIRSGREVVGPAEPFPVGTTARIGQVQRLEGGRLNLLAMGESRFRIRDVLQTSPYLVAEVDLLQDEDVEGTEGLATQVGGLFADFVRLTLAITGQWARSVPLPTGPSALADAVAQRLPLDLRHKQALLETLSVRQRLEHERQFLERALPELERRMARYQAQRWGAFWALN
ncbi:MAG TPA: LON peptidase substrate-binding domain-containing protein [Dehalococcoidia bacterium]|nr:LON peptidase substrate-binding domain-containing protein [Dehalococcoidia bacterium]